MADDAALHRRIDGGIRHEFLRKPAMASAAQAIRSALSVMLPLATSIVQLPNATLVSLLPTLLQILDYQRPSATTLSFTRPQNGSPGSQLNLIV